MDFVSIDTTRDPFRNQLLELTSAYRIELERLHQRADPEITGGWRNAAEALARSVESGADGPLRDWSESLRRLTLVASSLLSHDPGRSMEIIATLGLVLGVLERGIESAFGGASGGQFERLSDTFLRRTPAEWRSWCTTDRVQFETYLRDLEPAPQITTIPAEQTATRSGEAHTEEDEDEIFQRELLETFLTEVTEGLQRCEELLVIYEKEPTAATLDALFRQFHTLKGAAAAVDLDAAAAQLHEGESLLQGIRDGDVDMDRSTLVEFLFRLGDSVRDLIEKACGRHVDSVAAAGDIATELRNLLGTPAQAPKDGQGTMDTAKPSVSGDVEASDSPGLELLRRKAAKGEIDPQLLQVIDALDRRARHFSDVAASLQEEVKQLRSAPLDDLFRRLQRPARDAARQEGKFIDFTTHGGQIRIDRTIAERLFGPLLHLVRNAVAHGIEGPALREARGKSRTGSIVLTALTENDHLTLLLEDDGNGLDLKAILAKGVEIGWVKAGERVEESELRRWIFKPGFTTREEINELAGRGVGMDVVAREIESLHGKIEVESQEGQGATFRVVIPLQQAPEAKT